MYTAPIPQSTSAPADTSPTTPSSGSGLPSSQSLDTMFLQLLVAQLQNQDPTDALDPTTFVTQLAQFSELSEVTSIYQLLQQVVPGASGTGTNGGTSPASGNPNSAGSSAPTPNAGSPSSGLGNASPFTALPSFSSPVPSPMAGKIPGGF